MAIQHFAVVIWKVFKRQTTNSQVKIAPQGDKEGRRIT